MVHGRENEGQLTELERVELTSSVSCQLHAAKLYNCNWPKQPPYSNISASSLRSPTDPSVEL
eukprot:3610033-Amphidinium_carterae.2